MKDTFLRSQTGQIKDGLLLYEGHISDISNFGIKFVYTFLIYGQLALAGNFFYISDGMGYYAGTLYCTSTL